MSRKRKESLKEKKRVFSQKQLIAVSIALSLTIAVAFTIFALHSTDIPFSMNAVIIDQLGESDPLLVNYTFVEHAKNLLISHNFNVTYYNESLNVGFFRRLTKLNGGIIILRVHSALREDNSTVDLFTSEEFFPGRYELEWQKGLVVKGRYLYTNETKYFYAITYKFIEELEGYFPKSIVITMGCWSLKPECQQLAAAFIKKGAKAYIGWTNVVLSKDTDQDTITFLERLLIQNETLEDATSHLEHKYYDPELKQNVNTTMRFHPIEMRNLKISDLLAEVKSSKALMVFNLNVFPVFMAKVEFCEYKLEFAC